MSFDQPLPPFNASDPNATFVGTSCLDFLMIELVPMTIRVANELSVGAGAGAGANNSNNAADDAEAGDGAGSSTKNNNNSSSSGGSGGSGNAKRRSGSVSVENNAAAAGKLDEEEERDAVFFRLEALGYRVGLGLVERFSRDRPRFNDTLDAIKFVCKDLWMLVFKKQVDNLKTNHRGVYVLTDNSFRPLSRMSSNAGGQAVAKAQPYLWFPCGILRGALAAMGIAATVQAETNELPGAVFQIKTTTPAAHSK
ncbi:transport protein particle component [Biscogniauxia mediterranea]|nr:transport protein particle component [Biscogniauxia mediterranea]